MLPEGDPLLGMGSFTRPRDGEAGRVERTGGLYASGQTALHVKLEDVVEKRAGSGPEMLINWSG